jgi:hypothetical protein
MLMLTCTQVFAQGGGILVVPKRVVFENGKRSIKLNIANTGKDTVKYIASIVDMMMKEDGTLVRVTETNGMQSSASSHLRIYPKSIVLGPNETQTLNVQLGNTAQLSQGEYRSHILFDVLPDSSLIRPMPKKLTSNMKIKLVPVFYLTIPVLVRVGENNTQVVFTNTLLGQSTDGEPQISTNLERSGNMSTYGNIVVSYHNGNRKPITVANVKGVVIRSTEKQKKLSIALEQHRGVSYTDGTLRIVYTTPDDEKAIKIAETEIKINKQPTDN